MLVGDGAKLTGDLDGHRSVLDHARSSDQEKRAAVAHVASEELHRFTLSQRGEGDDNSR
jgi:hypothetical protein